MDSETDGWSRNRIMFFSRLFYHFLDIDAVDNSNEWSDRNNIVWLENGIFRRNVPYDNWAVFFDNDKSSTYG